MTAALCLLVPVLFSTPAAAAQSVPPPGGGDTSPPTITFSPASGKVFYSQTQPVTVALCDNSSLNSASRNITFNSAAVPSSAYTYVVTTKTGCGAYGEARLVLTLKAGANALAVNVCDGAGNCVTKSTSYTYDTTTDQTLPTVSITPASQTVSSATVGVSIAWCDERLLSSAHKITLNGVDTSASFTFGDAAATTGCNSRKVSAKTVTLQPGENTLTAEVQDSAGNWGRASVVYTFRPALDASATNGGGTAPGMFDATLGYALPTYRSLDSERSTSLFYASSQAAPAGLVQIDVTDNSANPAPRTSIRLQRNGAFQPLTGGLTEVVYATGKGTNRVSASFDASTLPTGAYTFTAIVRRYWLAPDPTPPDERSVTVRVVVVNERNSFNGVGWSIPGVERVWPADGGVVIAHGDGSASFYANNYCAARVCQFISSPGDFAAVKFDSAAAAYERRAPDGTVWIFGQAGRLTSARDRLGNTVATYGYDAAGRISTITDAAGLITQFGYEGTQYGQAPGRLVSIQDPGRRATSFSYDDNGDLAAIFEPVAAPQIGDPAPTTPGAPLADMMPGDGGLTLSAPVLVMTYDPATHRLLGWTDRAERMSSVAYDAAGRMQSVTGPAFTAEGGQTFRQSVTMVSHDRAVLPAAGRGTIAAPADRVDPATVRALVTDYRGRTTRLQIDAWGAPSRVEDPRGYVTITTRNSAGQVTSTVDAGGNESSFVWSGANLTRATTPTGITNFVYDAAFGDLKEMTGTGMPRVYYAYDPVTTLLDRTVVADTLVTRYTFDSRGRVRTTTDPEGHVTTVVYADTSRWRNTESVTTGGRTTRLRYDDYGRVLRSTDPSGRSTVFTYDLMNRTQSVTSPDQGVTSYAWGPLFLDAVVDASGQGYSWTRNALGWVEREVRPGDATGRNLTSTYDRYGRVGTTTNRRGQAVSFTYDALDRVATRTADGATTTFAYSADDPAHPTAPTWASAANPESIDTVRYDGTGRLTESVSWRPVNGLWKRTAMEPHYGTRNQLLAVGIVSPFGRDSLDYAYDAGTFQLRAMGDLARGVTQFTYTRDGLPMQTTLPTGQVVTSTYTSTHMPQAIRYGSNAALDAAAGVRYLYDNLNRIQTRISANGDTKREFRYDGGGAWLNGFTDAAATGTSRPTCSLSPDNGWVCTDPSVVWSATGGETFAYDLAGNPTDRGAVRGAGNRLSQFNGYTLLYDEDGNLTSKSKPGFTQTYAWNALGQLASVTTNGVTVSYGYSGTGQRVRNRLYGSDTYYLYDGINLLMEFTGTGVQAKYTYYPGSLQPHSMVQNGQTYYFGTDAQGSVTTIFNSAGQVVNQYQYLPFGEMQSVTENPEVPNRIRYVGRELESQTGLYYNNARWYDPTLHRFISEDPIGIQGGTNLYSYVENDPVNYDDPTGLDKCYEIYQNLESFDQDKTGRRSNYRRWSVYVGMFCLKEFASTLTDRSPGSSAARPRESFRACTAREAAARREEYNQAIEGTFLLAGDVLFGRDLSNEGLSGITKFLATRAYAWGIRPPAIAAGLRGSGLETAGNVRIAWRWIVEGGTRPTTNIMIQGVETGMGTAGEAIATRAAFAGIATNAAVALGMTVSYWGGTRLEFLAHGADVCLNR